MLEQKTLKNGKLAVTSTFFEDARLVKASLRESMQDDYVSSKWRRDKGRDFSELQLATVVQSMLLAKQGFAELQKFSESHRNSAQAEKYKINYGPWKDYESYESLIKTRDELEAKKEKQSLETDELTELSRVGNKIKEIDDFAEKQIENLHC